MRGEFLGHLPVHDPLEGFLRWVVSDRLGAERNGGTFQVFRLAGSNEVYGYREESTGTRVICKFYGPRFERHHAARMAAQEYEGLERLRGYGLVGSPHHVVRPLGVDPDLNAVIALEYYSGEQFSQAIDRSVREGDDGHLRDRLSSLAYFLATQHNRTASAETVDFGTDCRYLATLVSRLQRRRRLESPDVNEIGRLRERWRERPRMWQDRQVWLHGDATPANFLFGGGRDVGAIDLERIKRGDRVFDVGRVAGELQHAFMLANGPGGRGAAEPFIGHFLWEYCCHFPDRHSAFTSVTGRVPFFMALNMLRIAANDYITEDYGHRLVRQAKRLLEAA